ncbi:MAG: hypothetical protein K5697_15205 [Lachnospiraceae bacterium]|nr:hypothetical protein [Lachnospiraceae bacterium]
MFEREGNKMQSEDNTEKQELRKKKRPWVIPAIAVAVVALLVVGGVFLYRNSPEQRYKQQISLGDRYLSELDYEKAVAAFKAALEIDPAGTDAKEHLVDAYIQWGNALLEQHDTALAREKFEAANEFGERQEAIDGIVSSYLMEAEDLYAANNYDEAIKVLVRVEKIYDYLSIPEKRKALFIRRAEDLEDEDPDKAEDMLFKALDEEFNEDYLNALLALIRRRADAMMPADSDSVDKKIEKYDQIIALWQGFRSRIEKYKEAAAKSVVKICDEEIERISGLRDALRLERAKSDVAEMIAGLQQLIAGAEASDVAALRDYLKPYRSSISDLLELEGTTLYTEQGAGIYDLSGWHENYIGIYLGGYENEQRSGEAIWITFPERLSGLTRADGSWDGDVPNGHYMEWTDNIEGNELYKSTYDVVDGLYNGTYVEEYVLDGKKWTMTYTYTNGKVNIITTAGGNGQYPYGVSRAQDGRIWYVTEEYVNELHGITGWGDFWGM